MHGLVLKISLLFSFLVVCQDAISQTYQQLNVENIEQDTSAYLKIRQLQNSVPGDNQNAQSILNSYYSRNQNGNWNSNLLQPPPQEIILYPGSYVNEHPNSPTYGGIGLPQVTQPRFESNPFNPDSPMIDPRTGGTTTPPTINPTPNDGNPFGGLGCPNCQPTNPVVVGTKLAGIKTALPLSEQPRIDGIIAVLNGPEAQTCSASVIAYNTAKYTCGSVCTEELIRDYTDDSASAYYSQLQDLKNARNDLDENCMEGDFSKLPINFDKNVIMQRTGVLILNPRSRRSEPHVLCGAAVLDANRLISAKHCFFDELGDEYIETRRAIRDGFLVFNSLAHPSQSVKITSIEKTANGQLRRLANSFTPEDYIVLKTDNALTLKTPTKITKGGKIDQALIIGWFKAANPERYAFSEKTFWEKKIRWSKQECFVFDVTDSCMIHSCSTENGFSGAPVWTKAVNALSTQLSGVQSTYSNAIRECEFAPDTIPDASLNIASSGFIGKTQ